MESQNILNNVSEKYYYKKSLILPHIYTVCLLINNETNIVEARGVAICSVLDQPKKEIARKKSRDRAIRAYMTKTTDEKIYPDLRKGAAIFKDIRSNDKNEIANISEDFLKMMDLCNLENSDCIIEYDDFVRFVIPVCMPICITSLDFSYKSEYSPFLTENEKFIIAKKK